MAVRRLVGPGDGTNRGYITGVNIIPNIVNAVPKNLTELLNARHLSSFEKS
jgi:hypothetical protein